MRRLVTSLLRAVLLVWPIALVVATACTDCRPYAPEETDPGPTALLGPAGHTGDTSGGARPSAPAADQDGTDRGQDDDTTGASSR